MKEVVLAPVCVYMCARRVHVCVCVRAHAFAVCVGCILRVHLYKYTRVHKHIAPAATTHFHASRTALFRIMLICG